MKRLLYLLIILACGMTSVAVSTACASEKSPEEWIAQANDDLKVNSKDATALYNRGTGFYGKKNYNAAIQDLSAAIELEPAASDAYYNRGLSFRHQNKINEAISDFSKAITINAAQPSYFFERCNARIVLNDLVAAVADCSEAIRLAPADASGYFLRGVAHLLKGDLDPALKDSVYTLKLKYNHPDAHRLLYEILEKRNTLPGVNLSSNIHNSQLTNLLREV